MRAWNRWPLTDEQQSLAEASVIVTLPNGRRLRIDVEVMPDLATRARAELLPEPTGSGVVTS